MILKNKRGLNGNTTNPVVLPKGFLTALFNIEKDFHTKETFSIVEKGEDREHQLHHLTNADIQVATILLKVCTPAKGVIQQVKPHAIYEKLLEYYEDPISLSQFYASLKKLKMHGVIIETYTKETDLYNYQLKDYTTSEGKIDFFSLLPAVVFTTEFSSLQIAQKKLFYSVCLQQHGVVGKEIERKLISENENVEFSGLFNFLHRKDPYLIRMMLEEMSSSNFNGKPLLDTAQLVKQGKKYHKAIISIHPDWLVIHEEGKEYHDFIPIPLIYKRKANFIIKLLEKYGIADFVAMNNGQELARLVRLLKNYGYRVIRYAIYRLKQFVDRNLRFPKDVLYFMLKEIRTKTEAIIIDLAVKTNVADYIAPHVTGVDREEREFVFTSKLSYYGPKAIEKAFKKILPTLENLYSAPAEEKLRKEDYIASSYLNRLSNIELVRNAAWRGKKAVRSYARLEAIAVEKHKQQNESNSFNEKEFIEWMLYEVESLPSVKLVPDIPSDFKLEDLLIQRQLLQIS